MTELYFFRHTLRPKYIFSLIFVCSVNVTELTRKMLKIWKKKLLLEITNTKYKLPQVLKYSIKHFPYSGSFGLTDFPFGCKSPLSTRNRVENCIGSLARPGIKSWCHPETLRPRIVYCYFTEKLRNVKCTHIIKVF